MSTETSNKIVELALEGKLEDMRSLVAESLTNLANQIMDEMKIEIAHDYFGQGFSPLMEARKSEDDDKDKPDDDDEDDDCEKDDDEDEMDESEVNELSKKTLGNYVKKASKDNFTHSFRAHFTHGFRAGKANGSATKSVRKSINRENGIDKALNRLTKEDAVDEAEVNEISKGTLNSYLQGRGDDVEFAHKTIRHAAARKGTPAEHPSDKDVVKANKKFIKRSNDYMSMAVGKLNGLRRVNATDEAEVNELSKRTLVNYVKKASKDNFTHGFRAGEANGSATKSVRKSINRENGIDKALNRLTKEDAVDERDEGKPGKNFDKIANSAAKEYGSKAAGERVAGAIRAKLAKKHPSEYHESIDETDEVNELSKKTLGSYVKKAANDLDSQSYVGGRLHTPGTLGNKYTKKAYKRVKGIEKATDRLTK